MTPADLHVILAVSNPIQYETRARLCRKVMLELALAGVTVYLVEAVFHEREPEVADPKNPNHLIVRCDSEAWLKENMWNLAERHLLPDSAKYMMCMDADISFVRKDWPMAVLHALQHWRVIQPFSHVVDLGPEGETISTTTSFAYDHNRGMESPDGAVHPHFHPGFSWAWRRETWRAMGGMLERCVTGAADHHQALALICKVWLSIPDDVPPAYKDYVADWEHRANHVVQRDLGHIAGTILHFFHGWKLKRSYLSRWEIIRSTGFEPFKDLIADDMGLLHLRGDNILLRDLLRRYMRSRREDEGGVSWPTLSGGEW